ncbi:MAG TPA: hypothetical protein VHQ90_24505 [Thermoanaerobaculia bacterium]|nr:hypothetical protein [Thermoanaerobaculia bacterium]
MTEDYLCYYHLETYLFEDVHRRFHEHGKLDAFDLFSIIIWKANRAKSKLARRLIAKSGSLEAAASEFTSALSKAESAEARLLLAMKNWGFYLPMASAILTVLWPEEFTVYDIRVCNGLNDFHSLAQATAEGVWLEYGRYVEAVRCAVPDALSLRDKDRFLWGRSAAGQLRRDIARGFSRDDTPVASQGGSTRSKSESNAI